MPIEALPTTAIGLAGLTIVAVSGVAGAAIKSVSDKRKNGKNGSRVQVCPFHKNCEKDIHNIAEIAKGKVDAEIFHESRKDVSARLLSIEEAITGGEGIRVMVARLDERMDITNKLADAMVNALKG